MDLHYFWASPQDVLAFVAASQNGVFSLRIAHSRAFCSFQENKIFILMAPKDLNTFLNFVHAAEAAYQLFGLILAHKQCRQPKYRQIL